MTASRPCWPIVSLLVVSIAQYGYRYILEVNDPSTSSQYNQTPIGLSAIKYAVLAIFVGYSVLRFAHRPLVIETKYKALMYVSAWTLLALCVVLFVRLALFPGAMSETGLCALQLIPWMACVFFIPFTFEPRHDFADTLAAFERIAYWIAFPFWLMEVVLVILGLKYPALSYPGALVRFGGILDDPNGYACLCLLLVTLAGGLRRGAWKVRFASYIAMTLTTLSITGYIMGLIMLLYLLPLWIRRAKPLPICLVAAVALCLTALSLEIYETNPMVNDGINFLYSGKSTSAATHLSALYPDEAMLDISSPLPALVGIGGFSENFYWRILANFGWIGLLGVLTSLGFWTYYALRPRRWRRSVGTWIVGVLAGSNGIAYLLTFPLNLIYWCVIAMMLRAKEHEWANTSS